VRVVEDGQRLLPTTWRDQERCLSFFHPSRASEEQHQVVQGDDGQQTLSETSDPSPLCVAREEVEQAEKKRRTWTRAKMMNHHGQQKMTAKGWLDEGAEAKLDR
jgi:hypothetical protein